MAHVFISYKRQDGEFARVLRERLIAAGVSVWMDDQLHAGDDWREEIDRAIRDAFALVVIMSEAAKHSPYVTYEWACAWGANVRVIPVLLEQTTLHPRLDALQHRDFSHPDHQPFEALIQDLRYFQDEYAAEHSHLEMPPPVKHAADALDHFLPHERKQALEALAQMQHPSALEALKRAITTAFNDDIRMLAALRVVQRAPDHCAAAIPHLRAALESDDDTLYDEAIRALHAVDDPAAVPDLLALYGSGTHAVQGAVTNVIDRMRGRAVPSLMALLRSGDESLQQAVSRMLIRCEEDAVPALIDALHNDQTAVRFIAAHILGEIGSRDAVPALVEALDRADIHLRRLIVHALGRLADPRAIPALIERLDDRDVQTVAAAIDALGRLQAPEAVPALCHVTERPEPTLRLAAVQLLGRLRDPHAIPALVDALHVNDYQLRLAAVEALAQFDSPAIVAPLASLARSENITLRRAAVRALASRMHPDSMTALRGNLTDPDPQIAYIAATTLIDTADRDLLEEIESATRDLPLDQREPLIKQLRAHGENAVPALLSAINDRDSAIRWQAAQELTRIGSREVIDGLIALLREEITEPQRRLLASTLIDINNPACVPGLIDLFAEPDPELHQVVTHTIDRLGSTAVEPLQALARDHSHPLLWRIVEMLGCTYNNRTIPCLQPLLNHEAWKVRWAAAESLGRLRAEEAVPKLIALLYTDPEEMVCAAAEKALERVDTTAARSALKRWRSPGSTSRLRRLDEQDTAPSWLRDSLNIQPDELDRDWFRGSDDDDDLWRELRPPE